MRRQLSWLLALPLMAAGSLAAHALSSGFVGPHGERAAEAAEGAERSSAGTAGYSVGVLGLLTAFALIGVVRWCVRGRMRRGASPWLFLALPPLAFSTQEFLERLLNAEGAPFNAAFEPRFWLGLLLQVPFGLIALLVAWRLLGVVRQIVRALAASTWLAGPILLEVVRPLQGFDLPRIPALAFGSPERGPPTRT
jgi:hypothetical protein